MWKDGAWSGPTRQDKKSAIYNEKQRVHTINRGIDIFSDQFPDHLRTDDEKRIYINPFFTLPCGHFLQGHNKNKINETRRRQIFTSPLRF